MTDWKKLWFSSDLYSFNNDDSGEIYSIDTPPPTVSGILHMGHVFSYCHADFIARYQRICGKNVFYPIGYDDNGLPTERLTEKIMTERARASGLPSVKGFVMAKEGKPRAIGESTYNSFREMCQEVVEEHEKHFENLFQTLCLSFDWSKKYQTISEKSTKIAHQSFENLNKKKLIYNSTKPIYWDTVDQTALSQADIETKLMPGTEHNIIFKVTNDQVVEIMTTRPEMMPACVALLFHPEDERYNGNGHNKSCTITRVDGTEVQITGVNLNGAIAITPLGKKVLCIPDNEVMKDKGTGLVMCCLYGDMQDATWEAKIRSTNTIIEEPLDEFNKAIASGNLNKKFFNNNEEGKLTIIEARSFIADRLEKLGLLTCKKSVEHQVKCAERSGKPVEIISLPQVYLTFGFHKDSPITHQQFLRAMHQMANALNIFPKKMWHRLRDWIDGLNQDWCISRNRFSGVPIPGTTLVFDTWYVSSVSPCLVADTYFYTNKDPSKGEELFPFSLRPQAHEIIRTWLFYTIAHSYLSAIRQDESGGWFVPVFEKNKDCTFKRFSGKKTNGLYEVVTNGLPGRPHYTLDDFIAQGFTSDEAEKLVLQEEEKSINSILPWNNVALSGWCLAKDKTKMSKSKGNVVEPLPLLEKYGVDLVRYWSATGGLGVDTPYNESALQEGKKLVKKLESVVSFALQYCNFNCNAEITEPFDLWAMREFEKTFKNYQLYFNNCDYSKAMSTLEEFFWFTFCDNYIEIIKGRIYGEGGFAFQEALKTGIVQNNHDIINQMHLSAVACVWHLIKNILILFSPFLPCKTDELFHLCCNTNPEDNISKTSVHRRGIIKEVYCHPISLDQDIDHVLEIITSVRRLKGERSLSVKAPVKKLVTSGSIPKNCLFDVLSVCNAFGATIIQANTGSTDCECY